MGPKPTPKHTIERRENSKGYSPENCRWATQREQCANRRCNQYVVLSGETITVAEASRRLGLDRSRIRDHSLAKNVSRQVAADHYSSLGATEAGAIADLIEQLEDME